MISVIVATLNRAHRLRACLQCFATAAAGAPAGWELLVVDNGSSDDTASLATDFMAARSLPGRVIHAPGGGVARARNAGIAAARQPILAFTDDDCLVAPDWLARLAALFGARDDLALAGGRVELHDPADLPMSVRTADAVAKIDGADALLGHLIGCNFALRASAISMVGDFDERFGAGTRIGSAEDLDLFHRCLRAGLPMEYRPEFVVQHAHGRRTEAHREALTRLYLRGRGAFYLKHAMAGDREVRRRFIWELRSLAGNRRELGALARGALCYALRR